MAKKFEELAAKMSPRARERGEARYRELRQQQHIETERETDGRWIAEAVNVTGVVAYGATEAEAVERVEAILRERQDSHKSEKNL